jgi:hypothetical protein
LNTSSSGSSMRWKRADISLFVSMVVVIRYKFAIWLWVIFYNSPKARCYSLTISL